MTLCMSIFSQKFYAQLCYSYHGLTLKSECHWGGIYDIAYLVNAGDCWPTNPSCANARCPDITNPFIICVRGKR